LLSRWRLAACFAIALLGGARAQGVEEFYGRNKITIVVGSDVGGAHDAYARLLARYLAKFIPGNPPIIVQNMLGAGGVVAANYIANVAPRDGTVMAALFPGNIVEPLLQKGKSANYDPRDMTWIGNIASLQLACFTWFTNPVKTVQQARETEVVMGAQNAGSGTGVLPFLMNKMLGTKFKIVTGYASGPLRLALERGETQGICGLAYSTVLASSPNWILERKLNFLAQTGLKPSRDLPDTPLVSKLTSNAQDAAILRLLDIRDALGRPYVAPPGLPAERVAALRDAFAKTMSDQAYLEDARKAYQEVDFADYKEMQTIIAEAYAMPEPVVRAVSDLTHQ
jgi:tripartite-type tricarboxylate transporter receptor subunit TctC